MRVAVVMAGLWRGSPQTAAEYKRAVVQPLRAAGFVVDTYVAGFRQDAANWTAWLSESNSTSATFVPLLPDEEALIARPENASFFSRCVQPYHTRMLHLEDAWHAAQRAGDYDYVIKTRNDVNYGPEQFVKPCWLRGLAHDVLLVNDKEIHCADRWNERGPAVQWPGPPGKHPPATPWAAQLTAPEMLSDQFLIGTAATMKQFLEMPSAAPTNGTTCREGNPFWEWMGEDFPANPEQAFADFLYRRRIAWYTISFQLARAPSTDFILTPCRLCYDCVAGKAD